MEYFNLNAFILGALWFACPFLSNIIYSLLCLFYNIRIVEFSLFYSPWFSLHKETVMRTRFLLGWLPLGCRMKPLGYDYGDEDKDKMSEEELQFAFFNKPKYLKTVFNFVTWFIYILALSIALALFSGTDDLVSELSIIFSYIIEAFQTMFSDNAAREDFIKLTREISTDKNIVLFGFILLTFIMLLFSPITFMINWYSNNEITKSTIQKGLSFALSVGIFWLMLWKIPKFIFSFFTFSQNVIYFTSFLIGLFSVGLVCFYATLFVVKNISQSFNDSKME